LLADRQLAQVDEPSRHVVPGDPADDNDMPGEVVRLYLRRGLEEDAHARVLRADVPVQFHHRVQVGETRQLGVVRVVPAGERRCRCLRKLSADQCQRPGVSEMP
jgi:hypothetical protein